MKVEARIIIDIPIQASDQEIEEWLEYELGYRGGMKANNPLESHPIEVERLDWGHY